MLSSAQENLDEQRNPGGEEVEAEGEGRREEETAGVPTRELWRMKRLKERRKESEQMNVVKSLHQCICDIHSEVGRERKD